MSKGRIIPNDSKYDLVTFEILSEGKKMDPTIQIFSLAVNKEVNRIPTAKIVVRDGDAAKEDFEISNKDFFIPGKKIEIKGGWDGKNKTLFKGIIVSNKIRIGAEGSSALYVDCKDESAKLTIGRQSEYYEKKKDSDVIKAILGEYGVAGKVEATKVQHPELVKYYSTDWDFILSRAEMNGLLVVPDDGKVDVKAPDTSAKEVLSLIYGATILEFEAEMDARTQLKKAVANAWDPKTQKLIESSSSPAKFTEPGNIKGDKLSDAIGLKQLDLKHSGLVQKEELKGWADAQVLKSRMAKIRGRVKFEGFGGIKPCDMLDLQGVGKRFNGKVFVTGVRHDFVDGNWFTNVQFGLDDKWYYQRQADIVERPAAGLLPGVNGLQVGKVVKLEKDPDGENRIQVKLPIIDEKAKGIWARIATLDAGKKRGTFFLPEIDDEVIVGFINDDPRDAIVLGMMHSSKHPAPIEAKDANDEKGLWTRSEMKLLFDDKDKVITIETPAGNKITMSEKDKSIVLTDQNKNAIKMESGGITLDSAKDINITAKGKINIKAAQDLTMEGLKVVGKAQTQLELQGGAGAKLTSSAIVQIQGSLVKIN